MSRAPLTQDEIAELNQFVVRSVLWLPLAVIAAWFAGYGWYASAEAADFRRSRPDPVNDFPVTTELGDDPELEARRSESQIRHCYSGPNQHGEWFLVIVAVVVYGAFGWSRLGGWLVLPQVMLLMVLGATQLGLALDRMTPHDPTCHSWENAAQGGTLAGVVLATGLGLAFQSVACQPLTLRRLLGAVVCTACVLAAVKAGVAWRYSGPW